MKPTEWLLSLFLSNFTESLALERTSILVVLGAKKKKRFRLIIYRDFREALPFDEAWTSLGSLKTNICSLLLRMRYVFIRGNRVNSFFFSQKKNKKARKDEACAIKYTLSCPGA